LEDDGSGEIAFLPVHIPINPDDGDNQDQWDLLQEHIPSLMDMCIPFHLHEHDELLSKQGSYSVNLNGPNSVLTAQSTLSRAGGNIIGGGGAGDESIGGRSLTTRGSQRSNATRSAPIKKVLIVDDSGNSLAPAMAAIYLLLRGIRRLDNSIEAMKEARPTIEIGPSVMKGIRYIQQRYDEKVLKRMNDRLRNSVVTSAAF
jgi:hypothetical protein